MAAAKYVALSLPLSRKAKLVPYGYSLPEKASPHFELDIDVAWPVKLEIVNWKPSLLINIGLISKCKDPEEGA